MDKVFLKLKKMFSRKELNKLKIKKYLLQISFVM